MYSLTKQTVCFVTVFLAALPLAAQDVAVTVPACEQERRYVVAEWSLPKEAPAIVWVREKETGRRLMCQSEASDKGAVVRWLVPQIPAKEKRTYLLTSSSAPAVPSLTLKEEAGGWISVSAPDHEITRYHFGATAQRTKRPFFYPILAHGASMTRPVPLEENAEQFKDHPHQTGLYHAHGDVNGHDYWDWRKLKDPIEHKRFIQKEAGPVCAHLVAENGWGQDLVEIQDILILNAGQDVVMDFTITLTAANGPVVFGKTKEGGFALRLATGLTDDNKTTMGKGKMVDGLGNKGEEAIRVKTAPWVDYSGEVDGKKVGIAILDHPSGFRSPTDWHVRAYGLFALNPFFVRGEHKLEKGGAITFKHRVYAHAGNAAEGKVAEAYAGYVNAKVAKE